MVAVQTLLMNYFLLGLHSNTNDVMHGFTSEKNCPYGCALCSPINGCLSCKVPYYLVLLREGFRQSATCSRVCPSGFFKRKKKRTGFCAKCTLKGCRKCYTEHMCSICKEGRVNYEGKCKKKCPRKTYHSNIYHYCVPTQINVTDVIVTGLENEVNGTSFVKHAKTSLVPIVSIMEEQKERIERKRKKIRHKKRKRKCKKARKMRRRGRRRRKKKRKQIERKKTKQR